MAAIRPEGILRLLENACAVVAGVAALAAMLLVSADAVMRHLFSRPLTFQLYLTENYLLVAMLVMALPWGYRTGGFVRIGFLVDSAPNGLRALLVRAGLVCAAAYIGYLAYLGGLAFLQAYRSAEVEMGVIDWPVAWSLVFVPIGAGLLSMRLLADAVAAEPFGRAEAPHGD